eukprot:scaffold238294_cov41-Tisochrysis_lutea.AAC.1
MPQKLANHSQGIVIRPIDVSELVNRLAHDVVNRRQLYVPSELKIVQLKLYTWALVEYDRILLTDSDVYIRRMPFDWMSPQIFEYTNDPMVVVGVH